MALSGAADVSERRTLAETCDVEIRLDLNEADTLLVTKVTGLQGRLRRWTYRRVVGPGTSAVTAAVRSGADLP